MLRRSLLCAAVVSLLFGCSQPSKPSSHPVTTKGAPSEKKAFDFEAALARELKPLPVTKIDDATLSASVEAAGTPKVSYIEKAIQVSIPIGTNSDVECFVYDHEIDSANAIVYVVNNLLEKSGNELLLFEPVSAFAAGEYGALVAHAQVLNRSQNAVGLIKLAAYHHPLVPTLCIHDEFGYEASFQRIAKQLFETAKRSDRVYLTNPETWEVSVVKLGDKPIGFSQDIKYVEVNGIKQYSSYSSSLVPRSAAALQPKDSSTMVSKDRADTLLSYKHASNEGGELELDVQLSRLEPGKYAFSGTRSGKKISGKFQTKKKSGLATDRTISNGVKDMFLTGKKTKFEVEEYIPSLDPTAPITTTYEVESKEERRVRYSFGPNAIVSTVDEQGEPLSFEMPAKGTKITIERLGKGKFK